MNDMIFCPEREGFVRVDPYELADFNPFSKIGKEWMLITARDEKNGANAMTASWGGVGVLWNKPVAFCFVRPQRYTFELTEKQDTVSLCFLGEEYRRTHKIFGSESGRDTAKISKAGLSLKFDGNTPIITESDTVLIGRKLYCDYLYDGSFTDVTVRDKCYPEKDYHRIYVYEITDAFVKSH